MSLWSRYWALRVLSLVALLVVSLTANFSGRQAVADTQATKQIRDYKPAPPDHIETRRIQFGPQGSDNYLVWSERSVALRPAEDTNFTTFGTFDIMGMDVKTNRLFTVSNAPNNQVDPRISGSLVVWEDNSHSCATCEYDILGKDLATGAAFQIATGPIDQAQPAVFGRSVAWIEGDGKTDDLIVKDLDTDKAVKVTSVSRSTSTLLHPALSDKYIVWAQLGEDNQDTRSYPVQLQIYDRVTGTIKTLLQYGVSFGDSPQFALDGGRLVWQSLSTLSMTDLDTGQISVLYSGRAYSPVIKGSTVVWAVAPPGADGFDIYGIYLTDKVSGPVALTKGSTTAGEAAIANDKLAWSNKGGPDDGRIASVSLSQALAVGAKQRSASQQSKNVPDTIAANPKTSTNVIPVVTPGLNSKLADAPNYTNYLSKGVHAANADSGWYNSDGQACLADGGCPAVDALGATQATSFFGAVTALNTDLEVYGAGFTIGNERPQIHKSQAPIVFTAVERRQLLKRMEVGLAQCQPPGTRSGTARGINRYINV